MLRGFSLKSRWWLAVLQVVLLLATLVTPVAAASEPLPLTGPQLIELLRGYNVVRGDQEGNLNLDKPISRAEMITIMVRSLGKEEDAKLYKGLSPFPDAVGHWAETNIAYAHFAKLVKGDDQGRARPQDKVTYAEALTLLLRLLGKEPTTGEWPLNILLAASDAGLVPEGVAYANIRDYATRGPIFVTLAKGLLTVKAPSGKPFLAQYLDQEPPQVTLDSITSPTLDATVTVAGNTRGAFQVTVNGKPISLNTAGRFALPVDLVYGNNTITVVVTDIAGNSTTNTFTVVRKVKVTKIELTGPTQVNVGDTVDVKATAYDANNAAANDVAVTATVSGNVGTYANGKFTATAVGTATITFKAGDITKTHTITVSGPSAKVVGMQIVPPTNIPNPGETITLQVRMLDSAGNLVAEDNGRQVGLAVSGLAGVTITPTIAKTVNGIASFSFNATSGGQASLIAATATLPSAAGEVMVATPIRIQLTATPNTLFATGASSTVIRAQLVNSAGAAVNNTLTQDIVVQLSRSGVGDGTLTNNILVIRPGQSSSDGSNAMYTSGGTAGTLYINGTVISGGAVYTVLGTTITMTQYGTPGTGGGGGVVPGTPTGPATRLSFIGSVGPEALSTPVEIVLRVVDSSGNTVTTGNYPFTIKLSTSNNDAVGVNGLPDGVSLTLGNTTLVPTKGTGGVTGLTVNGLAKVRVSYAKSGEVTLEPEVTGAVTTAYDDQGNAYTSMNSSAGFGIATHKTAFSTNSWSSVKLTAAYTNTGTGLQYSGAQHAPVPAGATVTLTAGLYDSFGGLVPNGRVTAASLYKMPDTTNPVATSSITNGSVNFTVTAPSTATDVTYRVVVTGPATSNDMVIHAQTTVSPAVPVISAVRGAYANGTAHDPNKVALTDEYLQFLVQPNYSGYGQIKVYRSSGNLIYKTDIRNLGAIEVINVPKSLLVNNDQYRVTVDNGYGNSGFSVNTANVLVNALSTVSITGATYDATTNQLTVYTNGGNYNSSVIPSQLRITAPGGQYFTPSVGKVDGTGTFVINLSTDPNRSTPPLGMTSIDDTSAFYGDVKITATQGWYERYDGVVAREITTGVSMAPFATILRSYLDTTNLTLTIDTAGAVNTSGSATGYFDLGKFSIGSILTMNNNTGNFTINSTGVPGRYVITMRNLTTQQVTDLGTFNGNITAATGWFYNGSVRVAAVTAPVLSMVSVTSASYNSTTGVLRINGSGFQRSTNAGVKPDQITIVNEAPTPDVVVTLNDGTNTVNIVNDNVIEITLGTTDKAKMATVSGSLVFLQTIGAWFTDSGNRVAPQVTGYQCGVGFTN